MHVGLSCEIPTPALAAGYCGRRNKGPGLLTVLGCRGFFYGPHREPGRTSCHQLQPYMFLCSGVFLYGMFSFVYELFGDVNVRGV